MTDAELREVGKIGRAHGVRGDVSISLITDRVDRVAPGARLKVGKVWLTVSTSRPAADRWLVRFDGIADRNAAELLTGSTLLAEPFDDTDDDGLWVHQLIGAQVVERDGTARGRCVAVLDNPAHDLLELESGALVPVVFIQSVDDDVITIDPPDGLFTLDD